MPTADLPLINDIEYSRLLEIEGDTIWNKKIKPHASRRCQGNIRPFTGKPFPAKAERRRCTVSALNAVGIKLKRFISAPIWDVRYIHIGHAPESRVLGNDYSYAH